MVLTWRDIQASPVEGEGLITGHTLADLRELAIDGQALFADPAFDLAARSVPGGRQELLHSFGHGSGAADGCVRVVLILIRHRDVCGRRIIVNWIGPLASDDLLEA